MESRICLLLLMCCIIAAGCGGGADGNGLEVMSIQGPVMMAEDTAMDFSVEATGDTGITYQWACDPSTAGILVNQTSATTTFTAGSVGSHTGVKIQVAVSSDHYPAEIQTHDLEIRDIGNLAVGSIEGPASLNENSTGKYSISAEGVAVLQYQWECVPPSAGTFTSPTSYTTGFLAGYVGSDTPILLRATVSSSHFEPETREFEIEIREVIGRNVTPIQGPSNMDEDSAAEFSVLATDDSGLAYEWSCEPFAAGTFTDPTLPTATFIAGLVDAHTLIQIRVTVGSANYDPEVETAVVTIIDMPGYGGVASWGGVNDDRGHDVAVDGDGNIYVVGSFYGVVDFDPGPGVEEYEGVVDVYLSKFSSSGELLWVRTWGGGNYEEGYGVTVDSAGNVYVTGIFSDTVDFDPGPGVDEHTGDSYFDVFVSKFNTSGDFIWARTWGGSYYDYGYSVAVDGLGNVYVTGLFCYIVDFNPGPGIYELEAQGSPDAFLTKLDAGGNLQWTRTWGTESYSDQDCAYGVAVDMSGNVYVTGEYFDVVDFDPGPGVDEHDSNGDGSAFLSKFNPSGKFQWANTWGSDYYSQGRRIAIDQSGSCYVTGYYYGEGDFDPGPGVDMRVGMGYEDVFLSKFDLDGNYAWARTWGGPSDDVGNAVAVDAAGNTYVAGYFRETLDFDPGDGVTERTALGRRDISLSKFSPSGDFLWVRTWGSEYDDRGCGVALDQFGNIYLGGYYEYIIDFNPGSAVDQHTSSGGEDAFLLRLLPEVN